jgi:hypothetical protein
MSRNYFQVPSRLRKIILSVSFGIACTLFLAFFINVTHTPFQKQSSEFIEDLDIMEYKPLLYIKPFTSMVGFNGKFCKDTKPKNEEHKTKVFVIPLFNW